MGILHFSLLKRNAALRDLALTPAAAATIATADEFLITRDGVWLPLRMASSSLPHGHALLSGTSATSAGTPTAIDATASLLVAPRALGDYIRLLAARDTAMRCNARKRLCPTMPPKPALPCAIGCKLWDNQIWDNRSRGLSIAAVAGGKVEDRKRCRRALLRHRTQSCSAPEAESSTGDRPRRTGAVSASGGQRRAERGLRTPLD